MYCAYLRTGDIWTFEAKPDIILNHDGECVICDTKEESNEIGLTFAGMEPERFVSKKNGYNSHWIVTDHQYFTTLTNAAVEKLRQTGKIIVGEIGHEWVHHSNKNRAYCIAGLNADRHDGVIAEKDEDSNTWIVTENQELWTIANKKVDNLRKKRKLSIETAKVTHPEVISLGYSLANRCGFQFGKSSPSNLIGGILVHDQYKGRDTTNEEILELAQKWTKYTRENTLKFHEKQWLSPMELKFINKRFREIIKKETTDPTPD